MGTRNENKLKNAMGPTFGVFGTILVVIILLAFCSPWGDALKGKNGVVMFACFVVAFFYMFLDTWAIVSGKYDKMISIEDYIYASCKIFADFVLVFGLLASTCNDC